MIIQEKIQKMLDELIKERGDRKNIDNLKFLLAETQRGKNKVASDKDVIDHFVSIIRKQRKIFHKLSEKDQEEARGFIGLIKHFLPVEVVDQIMIQDIQIIDWIENNVDMTKIKNNNQIIGIVKKAFPYVDGDLVKKSLEIMSNVVE